MAEYDFINITKLMHCGVYLLLRKGEVVYVGKSKQPLMRIHTHVRNRGRALSQGEYGKACGPAFKGKGIGFDEIRFLPCMLGQLGVLEMTFIKQYMPRFNVIGNPNPEPRSVAAKAPIPEEIKALLKQMVVISSLPPQDDSFQRFIPRRL